MGENTEYGVSEVVLELQENIRVYIFEAIKNNDLTELEYNALLDFLMEDIENAPLFAEL